MMMMFCTVKTKNNFKSFYHMLLWKQFTEQFLVKSLNALVKCRRSLSFEKSWSATGDKKFWHFFMCLATVFSGRICFEVGHWHKIFKRERNTWLSKYSQLGAKVPWILHESGTIRVEVTACVKLVFRGM